MITQKDVDFYKENGYLLVEGVFNQNEVKEMITGLGGIVARAAKSKFDANAAWKGDYLPPEKMRRLVLKGFHDVHYHDASFHKAMIHPNMVSVLSKIIGPNVELHHSKMLVKPPEKGAAFPMHQDYPYFPHHNHTMLAASVHLDDATEDNGCLHVVPGSHKQGALPHIGAHYLDAKKYPVDDGLACPAKAGDVLFFNYLTIHGSKQNESVKPRRNVLYQYRDPMDKPVENVHVNWGQGLMISGENPEYHPYQPDQLVTRAN